MVRRPQCAQFCPFSHVSWVETLWTEEWKGCLGIPLLFVVQLAGRAGCVGQAPGCPEPPWSQPWPSSSLLATRWDLPLGLCQTVRLWWKQKGVSARILHGLIIHLLTPAGFLLCYYLHAKHLHITEWWNLRSLQIYVGYLLLPLEIHVTC